MSDDKQDTVGNGDPKYYESKCSKCGKVIQDIALQITMQYPGEHRSRIESLKHSLGTYAYLLDDTGFLELKFCWECYLRVMGVDEKQDMCAKCGKPLDDLEVDLCWECREVRDSKDLDLTINVGPIPHATFITKNDCTPHAMEFFDGEKLILALSWENGKMMAEYDDANLDKAAKTFVDALLPHMTDVIGQIIAQAR